MQDMIESLAICFSAGMIFLPFMVFVIFTRYISRKEKAVLKELNEN